MQITGRALRLHLMAYSAFTLMLTLSLVIVVAWFPLRKRITMGVEQSLVHDVSQRSRVVDETLKHASELGWQISSRTAARVTTAEFNRDMISLEEARRLLLPRLRDAIEYSLDAKGLMRVDTKGRILVRVGPAMLDSMANHVSDFPILDHPPIRFASRGHQGVSDVFYMGNDPFVIVSTPVFSPDQREVAHDLLLYQLSAVIPAITTPLLRGERAVAMLIGRRESDQASRLLLQVGEAKSMADGPFAVDHLSSLLKEDSHIGRNGDLLLCTVPLKTCSWWLVMGAQRHELLSEARSWLLAILFSVLGLGAMGLMGSMLLMRPLRDKILVAQDDMHRQVIEMEMVQAKLESQSEVLLERNEDLRHFAYASAHDLKSPLISIGGHAQILLDRMGPDLLPDRRQSLEYILAGTKRMFQHVNDMLDYSRASEIVPRMAPISLDRLCQDVLSSLDGRIRESKASIRMHALPELKSDRRLLRMVLQNLIDNALCYRQPDRAPEIDVDAELSAHEVVIRVKDNGLGIAPDHQPQIFDTFYRLHEDAKIPGTGLGLAICLRAVRRLDGTIELESEPGRGSCFTIRLPQPSSEALQREEDESPIG